VLPSCQLYSRVTSISIIYRSTFVSNSKNQYIFIDIILLINCYFVLISRVFISKMMSEEAVSDTSNFRSTSNSNPNLPNPNSNSVKRKRSLPGTPGKLFTFFCLCKYSKHIIVDFQY